MRRVFPLFLIAMAFGLVACGSSASNDTVTPEPTPAELDAIDEAAERAADQITSESADAEFEKLKAEMGSK